MKLSIWFLSVFVLLMSCLNCEDAKGEIAVKQSDSSITIQKDKACTEADSCSPLCTCNCCGQHLVVFTKSSVPNPLKLEDLAQNEPKYLNFFISGFLNNIWQPPKLKVNIIG